MFFQMPSESFPKKEKHFDHIKPHTIIAKSESIRFTIHSLLGKGTFGHVYKAYTGNSVVAIKVMRPESAYYKHGINEIAVLERLKSSQCSNLFVEFYDSFVYKNHLCIVQEVLDKNLYEILKFTNFAGFDHKTIRTIADQLLSAITALHSMNIVHCDLKPENIMLSDVTNIKIKIIDFNNSFVNYNQSNFYVQSRYYRAPEVILGLSYNSSVDLWSFGCILYELFIGYPLFPGKDNFEQISRISTLFGVPEFMIQYGTKSFKYYETGLDKAGNKRYSLRNELKAQGFLTIEKFEDKIMNKDSSFCESSSLLQLLEYVLKVNHIERPSAFECRKHFYFSNELTASPEEHSQRKHSHFELERNQPNPGPCDDLNRRASVVVPSMLKGQKQAKRKKSVFQNIETKENKK